MHTEKSVRFMIAYPNFLVTLTHFINALLMLRIAPTGIDALLSEKKQRTAPPSPSAGKLLAP